MSSYMKSLLGCSLVVLLFFSIACQGFVGDGEIRQVPSDSVYSHIVVLSPVVVKQATDLTWSLKNVPTEYYSLQLGIREGDEHFFRQPSRVIRVRLKDAAGKVLFDVRHDTVDMKAPPSVRGDAPGLVLFYVNGADARLRYGEAYTLSISLSDFDQPIQITPRLFATRRPFSP